MERARLVKSTVSNEISVKIDFMQALMYAGALNWATGETVAVKEIQLSNIPKGELGQIMVSRGLIIKGFVRVVQDFILVRNRLTKKLECMWLSKVVA